MKKFESKIPDRFHRMVLASQPNMDDVKSAQKELHINLPDYISKLTNLNDTKRQEITKRDVVNSVRQMIDAEKREAENDTPINRFKEKITKKSVIKAVVESAAAGEIDVEEERFLLSALLMD